MKRAIETAGSIYGATTALATVGWMLHYFFVEPWLPSRAFLFAFMWAQFVMFGLANVPSWEPWQPVFPPGGQLLRLTQLSVSMAVVLCMGFGLSFAWWYRTAPEEAPPGVAVGTLSSASLLTSVYVFAYWSFRPENVFPKWVFFAADPLTALLVSKIRRRTFRRRLREERLKRRRA